MAGNALLNAIENLKNAMKEPGLKPMRIEKGRETDKV